MAKSISDQGRKVDACQIFRELLRRDPNNRGIRFNLAGAIALSNQVNSTALKEALGVAESALQSDPNSDSPDLPHSNIGRPFSLQVAILQVRLGQIEEARETISKSAELGRPDMMGVLYGFIDAMITGAEGDLERAKQLYDQAENLRLQNARGPRFVHLDMRNLAASFLGLEE